MCWMTCEYSEGGGSIDDPRVLERIGWWGRGKYFGKDEGEKPILYELVLLILPVTWNSAQHNCRWLLEAFKNCTLYVRQIVLIGSIFLTNPRSETYR